ncbi:MAG: hypothetical protein ACD_39C01772G0003 [uncultured bacterium]|nr:MAG: hypothetical protein ACD_39C01772G0003 [uncultured bacterium]
MLKLRLFEGSLSFFIHERELKPLKMINLYWFIKIEYLKTVAFFVENAGAHAISGNYLRFKRSGIALIQLLWAWWVNGNID